MAAGAVVTRLSTGGPARWSACPADLRQRWWLVDRTGAELQYTEAEDVAAATVLDLIADVLRS
jgi:hypothetical protein